MAQTTKKKTIKQPIKEVAKVDEVEYLSCTELVDGKEITAKFRKEVPYLVWKLFFKHMYTGDNYNAARVLLINQYVKEEGKDSILDDEGTLYQFIAFIMSEYVNFPEMVLYRYDETEKGKELAKKHVLPIYTLEVGGNTLYIRGLKINEYSEIFNKVTNDPLGAWDYVYNNMVIEKTESIDRSSELYAACHSVPSQLLNIKKSDLKKK